jgi:hypothetical protein
MTELSLRGVIIAMLHVDLMTCQWCFLDHLSKTIFDLIQGLFVLPINGNNGVLFNMLKTVKDVFYILGRCQNIK